MKHTASTSDAVYSVATCFFFLMTEKTYLRIRLYTTIGFAFLIVFPFFLYTFRDEYRGLVPIRVNDDGMYFAHIQSALLGRSDEVTNGILLTDPPIRGAGPALIEGVAGFLFGPTRLRGPQVSLLLTVLIAPLLIPLMSTFLRRIGLSRGIAIGATLLFTFVCLSPLQRPVHMSLSLPLSLFALVLLERAYTKRTISSALAAGALFGVLPAVYFWTWTYLFAAGAALLTTHLFLTPKSPIKKKQTIALCIVAVTALLLSAPYFLHLLKLQMSNPFFAEVALRSNVVPSRIVESLPRSLLLTLLFVCAVIFSWRKKAESPPPLFPLALVAAAFVVMHQNLVHGTDFMFSSHYYPYVVLSALVMAAWVLQKGFSFRPRFDALLKGGILSIAGVFLIAGAWDYRVAWSLPFAHRTHLDLQHLRSSLKLLRNGTREVVLTDYASAQMIPSWTEDSVVFTPYVRHLLVSNTEFAERYCLSELPSPQGPDIAWITWEATQVQSRHLYPEREREFQAVCAALLEDPAAALQKYAVDYLLWNKRKRPEWVIDETLFSFVAEGEDWSLWKVK